MTEDEKKNIIYFLKSEIATGDLLYGTASDIFYFKDMLQKTLNLIENQQKEIDKLLNEEAEVRISVSAENQIRKLQNELGKKTEQVKMLDEAYSGAIKESKKWFNIAKNSVPKEVLREEFKEIFDIIKSEQFKVIMGDTTKCSRIKYILKEILGE